MELQKKAVYEAPTAEVVVVRMEAGFLQVSGQPKQARKVDYESVEW